MTTMEFLTADEVAANVEEALAPILPGVKVRVAKCPEGVEVLFDAADGEERGIYDIEVEAPPEVQKMFHATYGEGTHYFHNYAPSFAESFESAKTMAQQMALDYEAFRRTGTVGGGHA